MNQRPLLGVNYYPEIWPESEADFDIGKMKEAGVTSARIAEFAWSKMEPREGEYHFEWLHKIINKLGENGIDVILGTPTATPPIWLEEKDPEMMRVDHYGVRQQHGARRNNCSNNATYIEYSRKIVEKMGEEFGNNPYVIAWQIDNEIAAGTLGHMVDCHCEVCHQKFAAFLEKKYGTVEEMNRRWHLDLFSQNYERFDQVPMPLKKSWMTPHLHMDWHDFQCASHTAFVKMQYDTLKKYTKAPISTDMIPYYDQDFEHLVEFLDFVQINHYNDQFNQRRAAFWFDYIRTLNKKPFWVTETATCWAASIQMPEKFRSEGFCRANSFLPIVLGGEMNAYWLWRQHPTGHELMHGSVLYASGRPMHIFAEVQSVAKDFKKASEFLSKTKVKTDVAFHFSQRCDKMLAFQPIVKGTLKDSPAYRPSLPMYEGMVNAGIRPDVISPKADLSDYKLIFSPYLLTLELADLPERIEKWVNDGGTWVVGPMTDIRNFDGAHIVDGAMGLVEKMTGCALLYQVPDGENVIKCKWQDGSDFLPEQYLMIYDAPADAENIVTVEEGYSSLCGKSLVFKKKVGKGQVIVLGARPCPEDLKKILSLALKESGASFFKIEGAVIASMREGEGMKGIALQEVDGKEGKIYFEGTMTDILTEKEYTGFMEVLPYQTAILEKK
ncbi:MAG: beta-galactosidase [Clostridia bacterium]|nr:beta-galactosidase [Clostridia bacterium]